jgi:hypothetical protein
MIDQANIDSTHDVGIVCTSIARLSQLEGDPRALVSTPPSCVPFFCTLSQGLASRLLLHSLSGLGMFPSSTLYIPGLGMSAT